MEQKNDKKFFKWGLTALIVIFISILLVVIFTNLPGFFQLVRDVLRVLSPLVSGVVIAFLLNPLVRLVDKRLLPLLQKTKMKDLTARRLSRTAGVLFALIFAALVLYAFFSMLLPQLYDSITSIVDSAPVYYEKVETWILNIMEDNPTIQTYVNKGFEAAYNFIDNWLRTTFLSDIQKVLTTLTTSVMAVVKGVTNFLIGFAASIYILFSKEKFRAQLKKITVAVFRPNAADRIMHIGKETYRIFNGFVVGKIIDSAIIGVLCYIGVRILKLPYPALLSTIVGVTNIIPVFGPVIGAIVGGILIVLIHPLQAFYFVIFVIILQQLDGNVIGPKILGNTVGISGFWVLVSITLAASLFGFAGMLLGVPVFSVIFMLVDENVNRALEKKNRTTITDAYSEISCVDDLPAVSSELPPETEASTEAPAETPVS